METAELTDRQRGIVTIATGSQVFLDMARDLAFSLRLHCDHIPRAIVTDSQSATLAGLYPVVIPARGECGDGLRQKLFLDEYSPFYQTLFIDCDSLVVRNLDFIWDLCRDDDFGVAGECRQDGSWGGADVSRVCQTLGIQQLTTLNSGMGFFRSGQLASRIFSRARQVQASEYESLGFSPFRNTRNDEPGFAVALSEAGIGPLDDDGRTMRTPIGIEGPLEIDVLRGKCEFVKRGLRVRPAIMHFAIWQYHPIYYRERAKVRLYWGGAGLRPFARAGAAYIYWRETALAAIRSVRTSDSGG